MVILDMDEKLSVELSPQTWTLIFFLVKRGVVDQINQQHIHTPGFGCITGFADAMLELSKQLPEEVASPRPLPQGTLPLHLTNRKEE